MAARRVNGEEPRQSRMRPATTPEGRENQLISLATDLAEKQLRDGTASAQVITNFLKLGSSREKLEQERIAMEVEMLAARKDELASRQRVEELYAEALTAMKKYQGQVPLEMQEELDAPDVF